MVRWRRQSPARRALVEAEVGRAAGELARLGARLVVLFGSHARQEAGEASDADLLVVIPWDPSEPAGARAPALLRSLSPRVGLDLLVYAPHEFEAAREAAAVVRRALAEGRVLHGSP